MNDQFDYRISPFGEHGWIAQLAPGGDAVARALYVNAVADALRAKKGVTDCVAGVDSLVVKADPAKRPALDMLKALENAPCKKTH